MKYTQRLKKKRDVRARVKEIRERRGRRKEDKWNK